MRKREILSLMAGTTASAVLPGIAFAAAPTEVTIGAPISMTGLLAADGLEQKWAYEQAVADVNAKGGVFNKAAGKKLPVKLVVADD
ncbi:MAG: ABC transporter substrate-binding protein, partial [Burkholderiales bacterium]|nr:ABC transporter substrate-binding protein [Burkholderiales bacterium]